MSLQGKKILLGISAGIAAYKIPLLVRLLKKEGAEVQVLMTQNARQFVSDLTLATLSEKSVFSEIFPKSSQVSPTSWTCHVALGEWADLYVIAPATANTLAKLASGLCDDMLTATFLTMPAAKPRLIFPSMDREMYRSRSVQRNMFQLVEDGCKIIEPESGELASGLIGEGRMPEPENIMASIHSEFQNMLQIDRLKNKRILITAGATREKIDDVRFVSNYSSGKMGFALAGEAAKHGAEVVLISGKTYLETPGGVKRIDIESAEEMFEEAKLYFEWSDVFISAAAVADYRPEKKIDGKFKKTTDSFELQMVKNPDILAHFGEKKKRNQIAIGFALESSDHLKHAQEKLIKKNLDVVVLNSPNIDGAGFEVDTNIVTILSKEGDIQEYPLMSKRDIATLILKKSSCFFDKD